MPATVLGAGGKRRLEQDPAVGVGDGWALQCVCDGQENTRKPDLCEAPPGLSGQGRLPGGGNFWLGS